MGPQDYFVHTDYSPQRTGEKLWKPAINCSRPFISILKGFQGDARGDTLSCEKNPYLVESRFRLFSGENGSPSFLTGGMPRRVNGGLDQIQLV